MTRGARHSRNERISRARRRNRSIIVPIQGWTLSGTEPVVDLMTFEDLIRVAKKYESVVLEQAMPSGSHFFVWDGGLMLRYRADRPST